MARFAVALFIVIGLAVGVWWLWPRDDAVTPSTTLPLAATTFGEVTTTSLPSLSTTADSDHLVETVEEAEAVLRELWFGWFEGIYNQDEDRIREVVATEEQVETAREQFGVMEFFAPPTPEGIVFSETEILRSDEECLAVWAVINAESFVGPGASRGGLEVVRRKGADWVMLSSWVYREDLWEGDCESLLS